MVKQALVAVGAAFVLWGCGDPQLEVNVPLAVVNFSPHDGAAGIAVDARPTVCFNREMNPADAAGMLVLEKDTGEAVAGQSVAATASLRCLALEHAPLEANGAYLVRAKEGLSASDGAQLAVEIVSRFRTAP